MQERFHIGRWLVEPRLNAISADGVSIHLEPKVMQVLVQLAEQPGSVVEKERLIKTVWTDTFVTDDVLTRSISELRRAFGDDPKAPRFIQTIPKSGYRLIAPVGAQTPHRRVESLAVLPFTHQGGETDLEYLSDGLTECLINILSQLPRLRVLARSTVFRYKARDLDPRAAGAELKVDAVMTGRLVQQGDALRVAVEIVDVRQGWRLWGKHITLRWSDVLDVEEEIANDIASALQLHFSAHGHKAPARRHTADTEAYRLYLKARHLWHQGTEESVKQAIDFFERAIACDPSFALAYTGLAESYSFLGCQIDYGALPSREAAPKAEAAARQALELDSELAQSHSSLASVLKNFYWNWKEAEREFRLAIALNPHYPKARQSYADLLAVLGRADEARAEISRAHELDPFSVTINTDAGNIAYLARDYDRAIEQLRLTLELQPDYAPAHTLLGLVYEQQGKAAESRAEFETALCLCRNGALPAAVVGRAVSAAKSAGCDGLQELHELARRRFVSSCWFAAACIRLGQTDAAFDWLEKAYDERSNWLIYLRVDPLFDPLRSDPRFENLLRRMNFPQ